MNLLRGLFGLVVIAVIGLAAFYTYSKLSQKSGGSPPQTAIINDLIKNVETPILTGEKVAASPSSTTASKPDLEGFKEEELRKGLDNIKAGLDLLQNPFE